MFARKKKPMRYTAFSDRGLVRENNEDSHLELPQAGVFCVADGMGGGDCGELASAWVCKEIAAAFRDGDTGGSLKTAMERCDAALGRANDLIRAYAKENNFRQMGSTAAIFVSDPEDSARAALCHVGDSRVYRLRRGRLERLTRDHTMGEELNRLFSRDNKNALKSDRSDPASHILTRAVGPTISPRPDWRKLDVKRHDTYLICSDGVHDMLADEAIADALAGCADTDEMVGRLRDAVLAAGAVDNFTMICVKP